MKDLSILNQFQGFLDTQDIFPKNDSNPFQSFDFPEVKITKHLISDLEKLVHPRNSVLGKRMESFFEVAVKHSDRYDLIASNIQIIENKQTLGELDFLLFDKQIEKPVHVELVYKLYVYDKTFPLEKNRWIGPNRRDSLSEKLDKLGSRQFPLLYRPETSDYLKKLGLEPGDIHQELCFKAQLFTFDSLKPQNASNINPDCLIGRWYSLKDFMDMNWQENHFFSPQKKNWSCHPENNTEWWEYDELLKKIEQLFEKKKAPLIWMKTKDSFQRFFIVWW